MVVIKEVLNKKDLKKFVKFPYKLYKNNSYFIPVLISDEINEFTPSKNDAFSYCVSRQFIAYKNNLIVGRIATILNSSYNKARNVSQLRFTRYDVIDDFEVSKALFDKVIEVCKESGCNEIIGPIGFCDLDKQGMLVEGYERLGMYITPYNYPYYNEHIKKLGFVKDADWVEYLIDLPTEVNPRLEKVSNYVLKKYDLRIIKFNKVSEVLDMFDEGLNLMNEVYSHLYGYVSLTPKQIEDFKKFIKPIIVLDLICGVVDSSSKLVAYGLVAPSIGKAFQKGRGKLTIPTIFRLIKSLNKNDTIDMYSIGVSHEYQNRGVNAILINEILKACIKRGIKYAETGPELELNSQVQAQWKDYNKIQHKRRRSYILKVGDYNG